MYLTFDHYKDISGTNKVQDESEFNKLERDAEHLFNAVTHYFYVRHVKIEEDPDVYRVNMFRHALALQIDYTHDLGASTSYGIANQSIKSVTIDGTNVTTDKTAAGDSKGGIYKLALDYLYETGLLYRGVGIW